MKTLGLYRKMESLYRLRATADGTNRERWMAESKKWRERAEREIMTHHRQRRESVNDSALGLRSELPGITIPEQRCVSPRVKSGAVLH
jgi:hypothetical protein